MGCKIGFVRKMSRQYNISLTRSMNIEFNYGQHYLFIYLAIYFMTKDAEHK